MKHLAAERLRELLDYNQESGVFTWRARSRDEFASEGAANSWNGRYAGAQAGTTDKDGYLVIRILTQGYKAHRLAFLHVTGAWPMREVDHLNGNKGDNRWANLRDVDRSTNCQNLIAARSDNVTGLLGVSPRRDIGKFAAQIFIDGRKRGLGYFDTPEAAHEAYLRAKRVHHEGCTL